MKSKLTNGVAKPRALLRKINDMKKTVQLEEIRKKDTKALVKELTDLNMKLTDLQFKASFSRLKNFHEITIIRKQIARIWTIIGEKTAENFTKETK